MSEDGTRTFDVDGVEMEVTEMRITGREMQDPELLAAKMHDLGLDGIAEAILPSLQDLAVQVIDREMLTAGMAVAQRFNELTDAGTTQEEMEADALLEKLTDDVTHKVLAFMKLGPEVAGRLICNLIADRGQTMVELRKHDPEAIERMLNGGSPHAGPNDDAVDGEGSTEGREARDD